MSDESGTRVLAGRYRLITRLGHRVMRGWDLHLREVVAIRVFAPPDGSDQVVARASALVDLAHPGLVRVLDAGISDGEPFLVAEFIAGTTLKARLADGPMPPETVGRLGTELAKALAYAHSREVVHRDIRPGNILLGPGGEPYLTEVGIAELPTAAYVAPEQVEGKPPSPAADVYALGLVLVECLTGKVEYRGDDIATMRARLTHPPRVPQDLPFTTALEAMTATNPDERPEAAECVDLLQGFSQKARGQTRMVLIAAVSAAIVATGVALYLNASDDPPPPRQASIEEPLRRAPEVKASSSAPASTPAPPTYSDASTPVVQERVVTPTQTPPAPPPPQSSAPRTTITLGTPGNTENDEGQEDEDADQQAVQNAQPWYKTLYHILKVKHPKKNAKATTSTTTTTMPPSS
jgi:serine/threonine protein kinase